MKVASYPTVEGEKKKDTVSTFYLWAVCPNTNILFSTMIYCVWINALKKMLLQSYRDLLMDCVYGLLIVSRVCGSI